MSKNYLISVTCKDEIGIIANISCTVEKLRGNLGDLNQNVLDDYFSMILLASFPSDCPVDKIRKELTDNYAKFTKEDFSIIVWPVKDKKAPVLKQETEEMYILSASAKDRKGLVAEVSAFCTKCNLNILSLDTEVRDNVYNMIFLLDAGKAIALKSIRKDLKYLEEKSNLRLMFQHYKIFKATNEIKI